MPCGRRHELCQPRMEADGKPSRRATSVSVRLRAYPPYLESNLGIFAVSAARVFCVHFPAWWTRYLDSVSAERLVQVPLSSLF